VFSDLPIPEQEPEAEAVYADVVGNGGEVLRPLLHQRANQVFRNAAQAEAADHDGGAVLDISDCLVR